MPDNDTTTPAYLSIGSNMGDKLANLCDAVKRLEKIDGISVAGISDFYKTAPQNFVDQDWFINAALKIYTDFSPEALLAVFKEIEKEQDRDGKPFRFGPRKIDLDIIFYGNTVMVTDTLEIPHPRMHERNFVLTPLCDLDPNLVHPVKKKTVSELLKHLPIDDSQAVIALDKEEIREIFY